MEKINELIDILNTQYFPLVKEVTSNIVYEGEPIKISLYSSIKVQGFLRISIWKNAII